MKFISFALLGVALILLNSLEAECAGLKRIPECNSGADFEKVANFDKRAEALYQQASELRVKFQSNSPGTYFLKQCNRMSAAGKTEWRNDANVILAKIRDFENALIRLDQFADQFAEVFSKQKLDFTACFQEMKSQKQKILDSAPNPGGLSFFKSKAAACGAVAPPIPGTRDI